MLILFFQLGAFSCMAQNKYEREYRIKKSQFPEKALDYISEVLIDARRIRYYRETDSTKVSYEAKFKKERLWYSIEFDQRGELEDIEILIKPIDIPNASIKQMTTYLSANFSKYRIRKIQQQYPILDDEKAETVIKYAFQNLMLPFINYELIIEGKKDRAYAQYEILFDSEGNFKSIRKSLPPNYDHVLY